MPSAAERLREKRKSLRTMLREADRLAAGTREFDAGERHRQQMAARARQQSSAVASIGDIPPIANPERREACCLDLKRFLQTYFPASTGLSPFSDDHDKVIGRIQQCVIDGGLFAQAVYRGFAKTTISENAAIWATLYGHRRFVPIFAAGSDSADGNIDSIKLELAENDLLYEDFPEACHAVRALENKPQRCASQTHGGRATHIEWTANTIVLPTIEGSKASGAIIAAFGILGASRGLKHKRADGTQQRPDFVIIDDPQTDESAQTALQVAKRLSVIRKTILKLGGHNRKIAAVVNATVIKPDDLIEQLLDPKKFPAWQGERIKMIRKWADTHETLWLTDYARLRNSYDRDILGDQQRAHREATEFYRLNREKMDAGCLVSWEQCYDKATELSAIQHAYNALIDDGEEVFASECQNEPIREQVDDDGLRLKADEICGKLSGRERGVVPVEASRLVAFIDPKKDLLYWTVCAFADGFTGWVVDYGTYPDQRKAYFGSRKVRYTLAKTTKADSWEAALYGGTDALVNSLAGREWRREGESVLKIERILIDTNWGPASDTLYEFCRQSPQNVILLPSHGKFFGAKSRQMNEWAPKTGERRGLGWVIPPPTNRRAIRHLYFDTNLWKTFTSNRVKTPLGGKGCLSLFGRDGEAHRLFADHCCSETPRAVESNGRRVVEWTENTLADNDFFDCLVGCHVAASICGVSLHEARKAERKAPVKLRDLQKRAKHWKPKTAA